MFNKLASAIFHFFLINANFGLREVIKFYIAKCRNLKITHTAKTNLSYRPSEASGVYLDKLKQCSSIMPGIGVMCRIAP